MFIDIFFLILMIVALIKGYRKGLILGIFSFLAFLIGLAAALKLSVLVANYLETTTGTSARWIPLLAFALVFIGVAFLVNLGARAIKKMVSLALLGWVDKLGGILLYVGIYTIIFSVLLFFAEKTLLIKEETIASSSLYPYIAPWGPGVINNLGKIIPVFKDLFVQLQVFFENIGHQIPT